jgi:predicted metal-dependent phosphoesterase TrpH
MSIHYDLHSHSTASDGTLSPAELVLMAKHKGVDALALTDHDETAGIDEA